MNRNTVVRSLVPRVSQFKYTHIMCYYLTFDLTLTTEFKGHKIIVQRGRETGLYFYMYIRSGNRRVSGSHTTAIGKQCGCSLVPDGRSDGGTPVRPGDNQGESGSSRCRREGGGYAQGLAAEGPAAQNMAGIMIIIQVRCTMYCHALMQVFVDAVEHRAGGSHRALAKKIASLPLGQLNYPISVSHSPSRLPPLYISIPLFPIHL